LPLSRQRGEPHVDWRALREWMHPSKTRVSVCVPQCVDWKDWILPIF
jgi:hypothetical protein